MSGNSTLVSDIYKLLDGADLSTAIERFQDDLGKTLVKVFKEHGEDRKPTLRMSNLGKPDRQLWYELRGYEGEKLSSEAKFKFAYGHVVEALVILLAEASGHKVERLQEEVEIDGIKGHIDCVIDGVLYDVKSCSSYSFNKFASGELLQPGNDPFGYVAQLKGYSQALGLPAGWIAVDKTLGKICVLELPKDNNYDVKDRIKGVREQVANDNPPARCYEDEPHQKSGNRKISIGCSYCSYKFECWKDSNNGRGLLQYSYSTGPIYLSKVVKEPKVSLQFEANNDN